MMICTPPLFYQFYGSPEVLLSVDPSLSLLSSAAELLSQKNPLSDIQKLDC